MSRIVPSGREIFVGDEEIVVSKTDLKGVITHANDVFGGQSAVAKHRKSPEDARNREAGQLQCDGLGYCRSSERHDEVVRGAFADVFPPVHFI